MKSRCCILFICCFPWSHGPRTPVLTTIRHPRSHKEGLELLVQHSPMQCGPVLPNILTFLQHSKILPDLSLMMPFEKCTIHHQFCSRWAQTYLSNHSLNHLFIPPTIHMFLQKHRHARLLRGRAGRTWNRQGSAQSLGEVGHPHEAAVWFLFQGQECGWNSVCTGSSLHCLEASPTNTPPSSPTISLEEFKSILNQLKNTNETY